MTDDVVVLVDDSGRDAGTAPRLEIHGPDTPLHRAFSVHIFGPDGRVLLTRRALSKLTWPGVWTNSCCGHPRPGEPYPEAVRRRVVEELGMQIADLQIVLPDFAYRATDASGVVENEVCPVFVARTVDEPQPDPNEVMDYRWLDWSDLVSTAERTPDLISPWSALHIPQLDDRLPAEFAAPVCLSHEGDSTGTVCDSGSMSTEDEGKGAAVDPKEAMRQALMRKRRGEQHPEAHPDHHRDGGGGKAHGPAGGRREFRRKAGG